MFAVVITEKGGAQRREQFDQSEVTVGRVQGNDIILPKGNVSKRHSRIVLKDGRFIVVDLKSTNGTYVNGRKISSPLVVKPGDKIYIGDFILSVGLADELGAVESEQEQPPELVTHASVPPSAPMPPAIPAAARPSVEAVSSRPPAPTAEAPRPETSRPARQPTPAVPAERPSAATREPAREPVREPVREAVREPREPAARSPMLATEAGLISGEDAVRAVLARISPDFDVHLATTASLSDPERWTTAQRLIGHAISQLVAEEALPEDTEGVLGGAVLREAVGLGALEHLLADPQVSEVVLNSPSEILVDRGRGREETDACFSDAEMMLTAVRRLLAQSSKQLDPQRTMQHIALTGGPSITVVQPPLSARGPVVEIRRLRRGQSLDQLVQRGVLSAEMREMLRKAVVRRRGVVVMGPCSSGVTTLLEALARLTDGNERIVTVESIPDLSLDRPGTVSLVAGVGPTGSALAETIAQATQLRSDRMVIDDVAGGALLPALSALASRGAGDLVGVHAGAGGDCLDALRLALSLGSSAPEATLERLLGRAVDLVVEVARLEEGHRVVAMTEVVAQPDGSVRGERLFDYDGTFVPRAVRPSFLEA